MSCVFLSFVKEVGGFNKMSFEKRCKYLFNTIIVRIHVTVI